MSVIIPTFNRLNYLRLAIESVQRQTHKHWELIVVDDGSTDATDQYLNSIRGPAVRRERTAHCGNPAKLRNLGARRAAGKYLAFLDSDDVWEPRKLEIQLRMLHRYPTCGWSFGEYLLIDADSAPLGLPALRTRGPHVGWVLADLVKSQNPCATPTVVVERSLFYAAGEFDETILRCSDYDLWFRLAALSEACIVGEPIARIRLHPARLPVQPGEVDYWWARICSKLRRTTGDEQIRRWCDRECAQRTVSRFRKVHLHTGSLRKAVAALRETLTGQRLSMLWWSAAVAELGRRARRALLGGGPRPRSA